MAQPASEAQQLAAFAEVTACSDAALASRFLALARGDLQAAVLLHLEHGGDPDAAAAAIAEATALARAPGYPGAPEAAGHLAAGQRGGAPRRGAGAGAPQQRRHSVRQSGSMEPSSMTELGRQAARAAIARQQQRAAGSPAPAAAAGGAAQRRAVTHSDPNLAPVAAASAAGPGRCVGWNPTVLCSINLLQAAARQQPRPPLPPPWQQLAAALDGLGSARQVMAKVVGMGLASARGAAATLDLSFCRLGDEGLCRVAQWLQNSCSPEVLATMQCVNVAFNVAGSRGLTALAAALPPGVDNVRVSGAPRGPGWAEGVAAVAGALQRRGGGTVVCGSVDGPAAVALAEALHRLSAAAPACCVELQADDARLSAEGRAALADPALLLDANVSVVLAEVRTLERVYNVPPVPDGEVRASELRLDCRCAAGLVVSQTCPVLRCVRGAVCESLSLHRAETLREADLAAVISAAFTNQTLASLFCEPSEPFLRALALVPDTTRVYAGLRYAELDDTGQSPRTLTPQEVAAAARIGGLLTLTHTTLCSREVVAAALPEQLAALRDCSAASRLGTFAVDTGRGQSRTLAVAHAPWAEDAVEWCEGEGAVVYRMVQLRNASDDGPVGVPPMLSSEYSSSGTGTQEPCSWSTIGDDWTRARSPHGPGASVLRSAVSTTAAADVGPEEVHELLLSGGVPPAAADTLFRQGVDGVALRLIGDQDLLAVGITDPAAREAVLAAQRDFLLALSPAGLGDDGGVSVAESGVESDARCAPSSVP
eukprot:TRINITY_DN19699_c1_g1_i1.p1 TRINITY_DN19699_c1_g1~~TRINITY_DN19699_c1_g1_i1.p1  ORF type:complete len:795 (+),score=228.52 TRINITY_DN19699_c1_g1_i1:87-2387(+)